MIVYPMCPRSCGLFHASEGLDEAIPLSIEAVEAKVFRIIPHINHPTSTLAWTLARVSPQSFPGEIKAQNPSPEPIPLPLRRAQGGSRPSAVVGGMSVSEQP